MLRAKSAFRLFCFFASCLLPFAVANAQTTTATLSGTVTDERDAVVPRATVRALNTATVYDFNFASSKRQNIPF